MMVRGLARPMLSVWFVSEGADVLRHPAAHVERAEGALRMVRRWVPSVPDQDRQQLGRIVRLHGAAVAVAGAALATGRAPRLAGLLLAGLTLPLAVAANPFAPGLSPQEKRARRAQAVQSLSMAGAALLAAADTAGRPGIGWRLRHARDGRGTA